MTLKNELSQIDDIASVSSTLKKEELIKEYSKNPLFNKVVYYAINPFKHYNTKRLWFVDHNEKVNVEHIFNFLDYLSSKNGANDSDILQLSKLASIDKETNELINRIINKDLRCGASIKTFKKYIPEIPEYSVMLCQKDLDKFFKLCNYDFIKLMWSVKLDGVRCTTTGNGMYLSRNGKQFPNFNILDEEIDILNDTLKYLYPEILWNKIPKDGEVLVESSNKADFQKLMTQIKRLKEVDPSSFIFYIFDIDIKDVKFIDRYNYLYNAFDYIEKQGKKLEKIKLLPHYRFDNSFTKISDILELANQKISEGYEGLVLKKVDSPYENKYSKYWCKVKETETADVEVIGWEYGDKGKKYENVMGRLNCRFSSGIIFNVGIGFEDWEREEFMINTPKIIEIEYQELTKDGKPRFASFKRVREDKNEID
ncbi:MAG: hypothetical protein ACOC2W_01835 [bacterium]